MTELSTEILQAATTLGMSREDLDLNIQSGCLSSDLCDQIMERFDDADTLPTDIQKSFAILFRFSRTLSDPINDQPQFAQLRFN